MDADNEIIDGLQRTDLFAGLSRRALKKVAVTARIVDHPAGQEITSEGESGICFHLVTAGRASVVVGASSRRDLGPGDYFGEISLIDRQPRSATVTAVSDLTTVAIPAWSFSPILLEEPEVARSLLQVMCARLRAAEQAESEGLPGTAAGPRGP